jgi:hypothetical protein
MNLNTGEIVELPPGQNPPPGTSRITAAERDRYAKNTTQERLRRYKQTHPEEACSLRACGKTLRHHSLAEMQLCAARAQLGGKLKV